MACEPLPALNYSDSAEDRWQRESMGRQERAWVGAGRPPENGPHNAPLPPIRYYPRVREARLDSVLKWAAANAETIEKQRGRGKSKTSASKQGRYRQERKRRDPGFQLEMRARSYFLYVVRVWNVTPKTAAKFEALVGLPPEELRLRMWGQMVDEGSGMDWTNREKWHIDHIRPCCSFDFTDPEQAKACFHYKNLRPLWAEKNRDKVGDDQRKSIAVRRGLLIQGIN